MHAERRVPEDAELVELSIPALPEMLSLPRLTAAAVAARAGFDVEEVEDIRLAIEELCLAAFGGQGGGRLHLRFALLPRAVHIDCTFDPDKHGTGPDNTRSEIAASLSEQLLEALVDEHGVEVEDGVRRSWFRKSHASASTG